MGSCLERAVAWRRQFQRLGVRDRRLHPTPKVTTRLSFITGYKQLHYRCADAHGPGNQVGVLFNGEIYVVGGGTAPGASFAYNPTTNAWRTIAVLRATGAHARVKRVCSDNDLWVVAALGCR